MKNGGTKVKTKSWKCSAHEKQKYCVYNFVQCMFTD